MREMLFRGILFPEEREHRWPLLDRFNGFKAGSFSRKFSLRASARFRLRGASARRGGEREKRRAVRAKKWRREIALGHTSLSDTASSPQPSPPREEREETGQFRVQG